MIDLLRQIKTEWIIALISIGRKKKENGSSAQNALE